MKTCEQLKDKNKEKDVVTQSIKSKKARYLEAFRTWYVWILVKNL